MSEVLGPYGKRLTLGSFTDGSLSSANAILVMRRIALNPFDTRRISSEEAKSHILKWATNTNLGQEANGGELRVASAQRRTAAAKALEKAQPGQGESESWKSIRFTLTPEWRLAIGLGDKAGLSEIGLSLHGTYGFPIIPGSSLKGLLRHWVSDQDQRAISKEDIIRIFGSELPSQAPDSQTVQGKGSVIFFDAIPSAARAVQVAEDVVTPHYKPYYERYSTTEAREKGTAPAPPVGWNNPVPASFLTVGPDSGEFMGCLAGPKEDVETVFNWLARCLDSEGIGAKTAVGYGYVSLKRQDG